MRGVAIVCVGALSLAACQKKPAETGAEAAKTGEGTQASATSPASSATPPRRKPGLWVQTMSSDGMTQETKICLDEAVEQKMTLWGQQMGQQVCAKNAITPTTGGWKVESECDFGEAGRNVTSGTVTGDFNSRYVIKLTTTTTGAKMVQANGTHAMEMSAEWKGACPADMKPGDMMLPGGMKMNIANLPGSK